MWAEQRTVLGKNDNTMYRRVFPLLAATVLLLSGCAAGRKNMLQKNEAKKAETVGQPSDTSGDESM